MGQISLINIDDKINEELTNNIDTFEAMHDVKFRGNGKMVADIAAITCRMLIDRHCAAEWGGFLIVDNETRFIVGSCAFKGSPTPEGIAEIAYFTFPKFEGKGYGTLMVQELMNIAIQSGKIKKLIAQTSPEISPATKVLEKCGWNNTGEITDPEDGLVWQWEFLL